MALTIVDTNWVDDINQIENIHCIHLLKVYEDDTTAIAKFNIDSLPDEMEIIERFGAGIYSFRVTYFEMEGKEKKRKSKSFRLGRLGIQDEKKSDDVNNETLKAFETIANGLEQNNKILLALLEKQSSQTAAQQNNPLSSDLLVSKLLDKVLDSNKKEIDYFFKGIKTGLELAPEPEEKETDFEGLGQLVSSIFQNNSSNEALSQNSALSEL